MKIIFGVVIACSSITYGASYKSTEAALADINTRYASFLKTENLYSTPRLLQELTALGDRINSYIEGKKGIVLGKSTPKNPNAAHLPLNESNNLFDIWDYVFEKFTELVSTLQKIRLSPKDTLEKNEFSLELFQLELDSDVWNSLGIKRVKQIPTDDIRGQKKKIAALITTFSQNTIKLINKAKSDIENYLVGKK